MSYRLSGPACRIPDCVRPVWMHGLCGFHAYGAGAFSELEADRVLESAAEAGVDRLRAELDAWNHESGSEAA